MSARHRPIVGLIEAMLVVVCLSITSGADAATITRGPYLQMGSHNRIVVRWRTDVATNSQVSYGLCHGQNCLIWVAVDAAVKTEHEVMLQGLSPKTRYYYAVGSTTEQLAGNDANHFFLTAPSVGEAKATRIWVLGDSGSANSNARAVRDAYYKYTGSTHTDLWLMLGDNAYERGTDAEYQAAVFNMYPEMLRKSVLWPTLGNHDGASSNSGTQSGPYYESFTLPKKAEAGGIASGTEAYYSFDYSNIHFVVLDSFDSSRAPTGAMLKWLRSDLQATNQNWIIAYWHHPPYSKGTHDSDSGAAERDMRQNALPILESYGVDLVLAGHSHVYERSFLLNGHYGTSTTLTPDMILDAGNGRISGTGAYKKASDRGAVYTVAGSSGKTGGGSLDHPAMFISLSVLGSVALNVNGNRLDAKFIRSNGSVADEFSIQKGTFPRDIDVSPNPHAYGSVLVGATEVQTFAIRNVGGTDLKVSSTKLTGGETGEFAITSGGGSFTLKPGATRNLEVTFEPTSSGPKDTTLRVESNDSDEKRVDVALSGIAAAAADIDVEPRPHDYGDTAVGITTSQTFAIHNLGGDDLHVSAASLVGGQASQFAIASAGTPFIIAPGATRNLDIRFAPTSEGTKTTTLRIASDDPDQPAFDTALSGAGTTSPDIDVALTPQDYGNLLVGTTSSRTFAIRNAGTAVLQVTATSLFGGEAGEFAITPGVVPFSVAPGTTHNLDIRFAPMSSGPRTTTLQLRSNDPDESGVDVPLRGNGTTAPEIDVVLTPQNYGVIWVGAFGSRTLTIRNIGSADLQVTATSLVDGAASEFTIAPPPAPFSIAPGATHTLDVRFAPATAGAKTTTLRVVSDDANEAIVDVALSGTAILPPDIDLVPSTHDYGHVLIGTTASRTLVIRNLGGADLQVTAIGLVGSDATEFAIAHASLPVTISPGATFSVDVRFAPTAPGDKTVSVRWTSDDPDEGTFDVVLGGSGIVPSDIDVEPTAHDYGGVVLGTTASRTLVIRNLGGTDLQVTATSILGDQAGEFAVIQGGGPFLVPSGATHYVDIDFVPASAGPKIATFQLRSGTETETIVNVSLSGTGISPADIGVTPALHDYAEILVGTTASSTFSIRNLGGAPLQVTSFGLIGGDAGEFVVTQPVAPFMIPPGGTHDLEVLFTPVSVGPKAATLQLATDDPDESLIDVALHGTGTLLVRDIAVMPESYGFGTHAVGTNVTQSFVITNTGTTNLIVGEQTLTGPDVEAFSVVSAQGGFTLAPGTSRTIEVRFNPTTPGPKSAMLTIPSDDPDENPILVPLDGTTPPMLEELAQGRSASSGTVRANTSLSGAAGSVYLAVVSAKPSPQVLAVTGLGLTWNRLTTQCAGRSQTGIDLWWAQGSASAGEVTATLEFAPVNAVIAVARYSGVAAVDPVRPLLAGNTNGIDGECANGTDSASFSFTVTPTQSHSVFLGALALRHRTYTPESGYTKLTEISEGTGGNIASLILIERAVPVATTLPLDGSLSGIVDWAVVGIELKPQ